MWTSAAKKPFRILACSSISGKHVLVDAEAAGVEILDVKRLVEQGAETVTEVYGELCRRLGGQPPATLRETVQEIARLLAARATNGSADEFCQVLITRVPEDLLHAVLSRLLGIGRQLMDQIRVWNHPVVIFVQLQNEQVAGDWLPSQYSAVTDFCDPPEPVHLDGSALPSSVESIAAGLAVLKRSLVANDLTIEQMQRISVWPRLSTEADAAVIEAIPWRLLRMHCAAGADEARQRRRMRVAMTFGATTKLISGTDKPAGAMGLRVLSRLLTPPALRSREDAIRNLCSDEHRAVLLMLGRQGSMLDAHVGDDEFFAEWSPAIVELVNWLDKNTVLGWECLSLRGDSKIASAQLGRLQCAAALEWVYRLRNQVAHGAPAPRTPWRAHENQLATYIAFWVLDLLCTQRSPVPASIALTIDPIADFRVDIKGLRASRALQETLKKLQMDAVTKQLTSEREGLWAALAAHGFLPP